jgi:WhiB family redox-sensing transcriptional regulator
MEMNASYTGPQIMPFVPSDDDAWMRDSVCAYEDDAPMFPDPEDHQTIAYAKSLCARCPVIAKCLSTALDRNEQGVWGGTTLDERRTMKRAEYNRTSRARAASASSR